jgi:hypothetical protein
LASKLTSSSYPIAFWKSSGALIGEPHPLALALEGLEKQPGRSIGQRGRAAARPNKPACL